MYLFVLLPMALTAYYLFSISTYFEVSDSDIALVHNKTFFLISVSKFDVRFFVAYII